MEHCRWTALPPASVSYWLKIGPSEAVGSDAAAGCLATAAHPGEAGALNWASQLLRPALL